MGKEPIPFVKGEKHLGVYLSESKSHILEHWKKRVQSGRAIVYTTQGLGSYKFPLNPLTSCKNISTSLYPYIIAWH